MSASLSPADASVAIGLTLDLRTSAQANLQAAVQFARLADVLTTQHQESLQMSQQLLDAVNKSNAATSKFITDATAFRADVREALDRLKNAPSAVTEDPDVAAAIAQLDTATTAVGEANAALVRDDDALGVNGFQEFTITNPIAAAAGTPAASAPTAAVIDVSRSDVASPHRRKQRRRRYERRRLDHDRERRRRRHRDERRHRGQPGPDQRRAAEQRGRDRVDRERAGRRSGVAVAVGARRGGAGGRAVRAGLTPGVPRPPGASAPGGRSRLTSSPRSMANDSTTLRTIASDLDAGVRNDPDPQRKAAMRTRATALREIAHRLERAPDPPAPATR